MPSFLFSAKNITAVSEIDSLDGQEMFGCFGSDVLLFESITLKRVLLHVALLFGTLR